MGERSYKSTWYVSRSGASHRMRALVLIRVRIARTQKEGTNMAIAPYIETSLILDSFDLIQIETLINKRLDELKELKDNTDAWLYKNLADEQIFNYKTTLKKVKQARQEIKRIKAEADAAYFASKKQQSRSK
jgi:hypothetical protein